MPVPISHNQDLEYSLFPTISKSHIDAARLSSWYPLFRRLTFPSTVIDLDALGDKEAFLDWLDSDSIFLPIECNPPPADPESDDGSDDGNSLRSGGDQSRDRRSSDASSASSNSEPPTYSLPKLTAAIQKAIDAHGGTVFPKLNWTSPRDAAFIIPQTRGPLCCSTPADIYLLLKSSDLIQHDLDPKRAYGDEHPEGVLDTAIANLSVEDDQTSPARGMKVELVLRSFVEMNPSREMRCFVRQNVLLGISQRDTNYYDHLQSDDTRQTICDTIRAFWEDEIWTRYQGGEDYIFDIYLSSDFDSAFLIDFNPYRPSSDPLLFSYTNLLDILHTSLRPPPSNSILATPTSTPAGEDAAPSRQRLPILRLIDSQSHPQSNSAAPTYGSNMMPVEMVEMSEGRNMAEFSEAWNDAVARGMQR